MQLKTAKFNVISMCKSAISAIFASQVKKNISCPQLICLTFCARFFHLSYRHCNALLFGLHKPTQCMLHVCFKSFTAIFRKVVGKNVHATIPKGNMGYDQYTVPDTVAIELTFVASF